MLLFSFIIILAFCDLFLSSSFSLLSSVLSRSRFVSLDLKSSHLKNCLILGIFLCLLSVFSTSRFARSACSSTLRSAFAFSLLRSSYLILAEELFLFAGKGKVFTSFSTRMRKGR